MSTFDGIVGEFPHVRIDYFRRHPSSPPALAYFLSHVHSDHLAGLESCKSPFVYCSPATRELLLKLEKYPHRMNFAKGILETHKRTYGNLTHLLKPIPLETPTDIELSPGKSIRVTLFDANHCVGSVMFLIEGGGKAILYTGDIRSEAWWVHALMRHPLLIPYVSSLGRHALRRLDTIYLDTTFATKDSLYSQFPSKTNGIAELLEKVSKYPEDTTFYFDAWTFGYEDVWQALSAFLTSKIHVDDYRHGLYMALLKGGQPRAESRGEPSVLDACRMIGFHCGNHFQEGYLTRQEARIHSCERGTGCSVFKRPFVRITPIISRHNGAELPEAGAGGGLGDLNQQSEIEIDSDTVSASLVNLCVEKLQDQPELLAGVLQTLAPAMKDHSKTILLEDSAIDDRSGKVELEDLDGLPIGDVVSALARQVRHATARPTTRADAAGKSQLPKQITFPYSRHSSYSELCMLVEAFLPRNIHPCTVDETKWNAMHSMGFLFGHLYNEPLSFFRHDLIMLKKAKDAVKNIDEAPTHLDHEQSAFPHLLSQGPHERRGQLRESEPNLKRKRVSPYTRSGDEGLVEHCQGSMQGVMQAAGAIDCPSATTAEDNRHTMASTSAERGYLGESSSRHGAPDAHERRNASLAKTRVVSLPYANNEAAVNPRSPPRLPARRASSPSEYISRSHKPASKSCKVSANSSAQKLDASKTRHKPSGWVSSALPNPKAQSERYGRLSPPPPFNGTVDQVPGSPQLAPEITFQGGERARIEGDHIDEHTACPSRREEIRNRLVALQDATKTRTLSKRAASSSALEQDAGSRPAHAAPDEDPGLEESGTSANKIECQSASTNTEELRAAALLRITLRQEAHDAALGKNGTSWWDIGLVSVRGHQEEETEL